MVDPDDRDMDRPLTVSLTRMMVRWGVSRFSPDPQRALEAAEQRGRELGMATASSSDDAA